MAAPSLPREIWLLVLRLLDAAGDYNALARTCAMMAELARFDSARAKAHLLAERFTSIIVGNAPLRAYGQCLRLRNGLRLEGRFCGCRSSVLVEGTMHAGRLHGEMRKWHCNRKVEDDEIVLWYRGGPRALSPPDHPLFYLDDRCSLVEGKHEGYSICHGAFVDEQRHNNHSNLPLVPEKLDVQWPDVALSFVERPYTSWIRYFEDDKCEGPCQQWSDAGMDYLDCTNYSGDKRHGYRWRVQFYGELPSLILYEDGEWQCEIDWHANGVIKARRYGGYQKDGMCLLYHPNGNPRLIYYVESLLREGSEYHFDEAGHLTMVRPVRRSALHGYCETYNREGRVARRFVDNEYDDDTEY